jgi:hypothetical protein
MRMFECHVLLAARASPGEIALSMSSVVQSLSLPPSAGHGVL